MAYTGFTVSDVDELAARYGNEIVHMQTNLMAPFFAQKLRKQYRPGRVGIVNVKGGGITSTKWLADGAALPAKANKQPKQGTYLPKIIFSRLGLPRLAAALVIDEGEGVALVRENLETMGADIARQRGRGVIKSSLGSPASIVDTSNITVSDPSGWREGMNVDRYNSGGTFQETVEVTNVDIPATGAATITFGATDTRLITDVFYLQGAKDDAPTSLSDVFADASLYGVSQNGDDWSGNRKAVGGALGLADMRTTSVLVRRRSSERYNLLLANSLNEKRYVDLNIAQRRFMPGHVLDQYGNMRTEFEGVEMFIDENVPDDEIYMLNTRHIEWHESVKLGHDRDGPPRNMHRGGTGNPVAHVDDTDFVFDIQAWEAGNLRATKRNSGAVLTGITS